VVDDMFGKRVFASLHDWPSVDCAYSTRCPGVSSLTGAFFHESVNVPSWYVIIAAWLYQPPSSDPKYACDEGRGLTKVAGKRGGLIVRRFEPRSRHANVGHVRQSREAAERSDSAAAPTSKATVV
jgi:hypothetical protein